MAILLRITAAVLALEEPGRPAESAASALAATAGEEIAPAPSLLRGMSALFDEQAAAAIHGTNGHEANFAAEGQESTSCKGQSACHETEAEVGDHSCIGTWVCSMAKGVIEDHSCNGLQACYEDRVIGEIPSRRIRSDSCNGEMACFYAGPSVGSGSCNSKHACSAFEFDWSGSIVGDNSCNDEKSCHNVNAYIGDNACNGGKGACEEYTGLKPIDVTLKIEKGKQCVRQRSRNHPDRIVCFLEATKDNRQPGYNGNAFKNDVPLVKLGTSTNCSFTAKPIAWAWAGKYFVFETSEDPSHQITDQTVEHINNCVESHPDNFILAVIPNDCPSVEELEAGGC